MLEFLKSPAFLWTLFGLLVSGLLMWIISYFVASYIVYNKTMRRKSKDKWSRAMSPDLEPDAKKMYEIGLDWEKGNAKFKKEVHIVNNGYNLYGEYFDFGYDRCAVVLSGRTECLRYGYYFAIPYARCGYNILVFDPRAHGLSDGEFNTSGFEESKDAACWVKMLKNDFGIRSVVFHCICIGSATGLYSILSEDCPKIVDGIVTEGMYPNFGESMKNHLKELKKPVFIMHNLINMWMKHYTGHQMYFGPIDVIDRLNVPLMMLHSKEDLYSTPEYAQKLYDKAGSKNKSLVWFEHGKHSMLRITDTKLYDDSIAGFLSALNN